MFEQQQSQRPLRCSSSQQLFSDKRLQRRRRAVSATLNFGDSYSAECIYSDSDNGDDGSAPTAVVTSTVTMGMSSSDGNFRSRGNCYDGTAPAASATMVMTAQLQRRRQAASASGHCCQSTRTHAGRDRAPPRSLLATPTLPSKLKLVFT